MRKFGALVVGGWLLCTSGLSLAQPNNGGGVGHDIKEMCELDGGTFYDEGSKYVCYYPNGDVIVCDTAGNCKLLQSSAPPPPHHAPTLPGPAPTKSRL